MRERDYALKSRRRVFEQEIKRLRRIMQGGNVHVWPFMTDFWGDYFEKQTNIFVNEIVQEDHYREMHTSDYAQSQDAKERLSFYRNILYCVLRALTSEYTDYLSGSVIGCGKPEDVLFSDVAVGFDGEDGELLDSFVVYYMSAIYEIVSGEEIDLSSLNSGMADTEKLTEEEERQLLEEAESWEEEEEAWAREHGFDIEALREDDRIEEEQMQERARQEQERIRKEFVAPEHFCRSLEAVLEYLKEHADGADRMQEEIEELLFGFLSYRSLSVFDEEKAYVETMIQLKKATRTAQEFGEE